ncbi:MAG: response regulator transcription factor [Candidatus Omnitrophota bacterium]
MKPAKVLIVDDHPIVREGLKQLIQQDEALEVCGEAEDCVAALELIQSTRPDVAVIDLSLKKSSGMDLLKSAKKMAPEMKILVLSMYNESVYAERVLRAGANGYLMKHQAMTNILDGIHRIMNREICVSENIAKKILHEFAQQPSSPSDNVSEILSDRELEVFALYGQGLKTRDIADRLIVSVKTIESHREHIIQKLHLKNSAELVCKAVEFVLTEQKPSE